MFDVAAQQGAGSVTVAHVVERSGVSRRTFYEHFSDREDCLLAAFERALTLASDRVVPCMKPRGLAGADQGGPGRVPRLLR